MQLDLIDIPPDELKARLGQAGFESRCGNWILVDYSRHSVHSLFTDTVFDEVRLFCASACQKDYREVAVEANQLLVRWGLIDFGMHRFGELSGGTRKFLLLALQVEAVQPADSVLACDIQQELDQHRLATFVSEVSNRGARRLIFSEFDPIALGRKLAGELPRLTYDTWLRDESDLAGRLGHV